MTEPKPRTVTRDEWLRVRAELLAREKAHTREGDELAAARRRLPMVLMAPVSVVGSSGSVSLHDVFHGRRLLIVYHFMWNRGAPHDKQCEGCTHSQTAITPAVCEYLADRDVTYAVFSSGPLDKILAYRDFMGWTTPWYSTSDSGNELATRDGGDLRCYLATDEGVYQTYETKWRGIEAMLPTLQLLDLSPYGRQETWEDSPENYPQVKAGSWWLRAGRPLAQWTRTNVPVTDALVTISPSSRPISAQRTARYRPIFYCSQPPAPRIGGQNWGTLHIDTAYLLSRGETRGHCTLVTRGGDSGDSGTG